MIKFRAWDKHDNSWVNYPVFIGTDGEVYWEHYERGLQEDSGLVISQSTGLKDTNGVEIYEGDIVKLTEKTINGGIDTHTCKVFQSKSGAWRLEGHPDFSRKYTTKRELYSVRSRIEVIGNIYENPELLEVAE